MKPSVLNIKEIEGLYNDNFRNYNLTNTCTNLYDPVHYLLELPSKKMRPILVILSTQLCGGDINKALHPSFGTELFHNFSLMHDDIMDNAKLRRGFKSVHEKWNVNQAILSGDVMLLEAYRHIIFNIDESIKNKVFDEFTKTSIDVCMGQQYDMDYEEVSVVSMEKYIDMIRLKTATLIGFCLKLGALIANVKDQELLNKFYSVGEKLGIAFQLRDDLLDTFGDKEFGKKIGGDIKMAKKTYLYLIALNKSNEKDRKRLEEIYAQPQINDEMIAEIINIFKIYNADKDLIKLIDYYTHETIELVKSLSFNEDSKEPLFEIINKLQNRGS